MDFATMCKKPTCEDVVRHWLDAPNGSPDTVALRGYAKRMLNEAEIEVIRLRNLIDCLATRSRSTCICKELRDAAWDLEFGNERRCSCTEPEKML